MKNLRNKLLALVAFVSVTLGHGTVLAEANPFSDVPQGHWAYQAIDKLAEAGVLQGYDTKKYGGDRLLTRYEMAAVVARACARMGLPVDMNSLQPDKKKHRPKSRDLQPADWMTRPQAGKEKTWQNARERLPADRTTRQQLDTKLAQNQKNKEQGSGNNHQPATGVEQAEEQRPGQQEALAAQQPSQGANQRQAESTGQQAGDDQDQQPYWQAYASQETWEAVEKLAKEFYPEMSSLGVRIAKLERNDDLVIWPGKLEYTAVRYHSSNGVNNYHYDSNAITLDPEAAINDNWTVHGKIEAVHIFRDDYMYEEPTLVRAWAEADYGAMNYKVGRIWFCPIEESAVLFDMSATGAWITMGHKKLNLDVAFLRKDFYEEIDPEPGVANLQSFGIIYSTDGIQLGSRFYNISGINMSGSESWNANYIPYGKDNARIWSFNASYSINDDVSLGAVYAHNYLAQYYKNSWVFFFNYKASDQEVPGSWSAYAAYRNYSAEVSFCGNTDGMPNLNAKGWEIGASYVLWKNMVLNIKHGRGRQHFTGEKVFQNWFCAEMFF